LPGWMLVTYRLSSPVRRIWRAARSLPGPIPELCKDLRVPTYSPKASEINRSWFVVDAEGVVLGRLATEVARVLRGKHKPTFAPHIDTGDHVVIINADKVVLTAGKADKKMVYRHSGYPGGIKEQTYADLLEKKPADAVRRTVRGMVPKNRLGRQQLKKLKVYAGPTHPHAAQSPQPLQLDPRARARA
jgi:large subunit ribosomal protein L13